MDIRGVNSGPDVHLVVAEVSDACKMHGLGAVEMAVAVGTMVWPEKGRPMVTAGLLGLGKIMPSYSSVGPDVLILGWATTDGMDTLMSLDDVSLDSWCDCTGPTP